MPTSLKSFALFSLVFDHKDVTRALETITIRKMRLSRIISLVKIGAWRRYAKLSVLRVERKGQATPVTRRMVDLCTTTAELAHFERLETM